MAILTEDIKIMKSAVMADVPEGGGAMTGLAVVDGMSNDILPDTSAVSRALGKFELRKLFGVAHSGNVDVLLGAHAILTDAPDDPLVHCTLLDAKEWMDTRTEAVDTVEKYLVKGPRLTVRIYDTHYATSGVLRLITFVDATFPAGGDAIVLRTPAGLEQTVRLLKVTVDAQQIAVQEGGTTIVLPAKVATCVLSSELEFDFVGPPALRIVSEAAYASVYSTTGASGAKFYGIKALGEPAAPGDMSVTTAGGIFTPLVPSATSESPLLDQYPLSAQRAIIHSEFAPSITFTSTAQAAVVLGPGVTLYFPTAIKPETLLLTHGAVAFADKYGFGTLYQGSLLVGTIDYAGRSLTMLAGCPFYGTASPRVTYVPATAVGASAHSAALLITSANQGRVFVNTFTPPAPGSLVISYMSQGRWYELRDNAYGKLEGGSPSHGIGSISYATGSMSLTLGAMPDVGSSIIAMWGDPTAAAPVNPDGLPEKAAAYLTLDPLTAPEGIAISWMQGAFTLTATTDAAGNVVSGAATGKYQNGVLKFQPTTLPSGDVTVTSTLASSPETSIADGNTPGQYLLTAAPALAIRPGSFKASVLLTYPGTVMPISRDSPLPLWDVDGTVYLGYRGQQIEAVGTISYATGELSINSTVDLVLANRGTGITVGWQGGGGVLSSFLQVVTCGLQAPITNVSYAAGGLNATPDVRVFSITEWELPLATNGPPLVLTDTMFTVGGDLYTVQNGVVRKGWNLITGLPAVENAGSASGDGRIVLSAAGLPASRASATVWYNAVQDVSAKQVGAGVFRIASSPVKSGSVQIQVGERVGTSDDAGVITGGGFTGSVDSQRGIVTWVSSTEFDPSLLSYNAVALQYLPLNKDLLGINPARLPLDGNVPIYRPGDLVVVHNTLTTQLVNPVSLNAWYTLGRERTASVRVKDFTQATVPSTLYETDLDAGKIRFHSGANLDEYTQPFSVEHRVEDMMTCVQADISGKLTFSRSLTQTFLANSSYVSSALVFGDLWARVFNYVEQQTWTGLWSDELIGTAPLAQFNSAQYPITTTNKGALTERWAVIFTSASNFRMVGESVGDIGSGNTMDNFAPINPATGAPYVTIPALGWGNWFTGAVLRFNTVACGAPFWVARTVLQGPASLARDSFSLAFRADVDRP